MLSVVPLPDVPTHKSYVPLQPRALRAIDRTERDNVSCIHIYALLVVTPFYSVRQRGSEGINHTVHVHMRTLFCAILRRRSDMSHALPHPSAIRPTNSL